MIYGKSEDHEEERGVVHFSELSALYQHAENVPSCSSLNKHGCLTKLERFITRCLQ